MVDVSVASARELVPFHFEEHLLRHPNAQSSKRATEVVHVLLIKACLLIVKVRVEWRVFFAFSEDRTEDIVERTVITQCHRHGACL